MRCLGNPRTGVSADNQGQRAEDRDRTGQSVLASLPNQQ
jgi:hypothetical protein